MKLKALKPFYDKKTRELVNCDEVIEVNKTRLSEMKKHPLFESYLEELEDVEDDKDDKDDKGVEDVEDVEEVEDDKETSAKK